jgi:hypothetical protein
VRADEAVRRRGCEKINARSRGVNGHVAFHSVKRRDLIDGRPFATLFLNTGVGLQQKIHNLYGTSPDPPPAQRPFQEQLLNSNKQAPRTAQLTKH